MLKTVSQRHTFDWWEMPWIHNELKYIESVAILKLITQDLKMHNYPSMIEVLRLSKTCDHLIAVLMISIIIVL